MMYVKTELFFFVQKHSHIYYDVFNSNTKAVYYFNEDRLTFVIPLPLGGKSTEDLNFPPALTTPNIFLSQFGLEIKSMEIPIPELVVPESLTLSIPLFGTAEVSTMMTNWRSALPNKDKSC